MSEQQILYRIRVRGHLGRNASTWFPDMAVALREDGDSVLTGLVRDQAALHALLRKIRDLGLPLLELSRVHPEPARDPDRRA